MDRTRFAVIIEYGSPSDPEGDPSSSRRLSIPNGGIVIATRPHRRRSGALIISRSVTVGASVSKTHHILIVEDDAELRRLWRLSLTLEGFDVTEVGDGIDALRLLEQQRPDLIVLDLGLPRLPGLSVQQEIAAQALTSQLPIVIVTASTDDLGHVPVPCVLRKPFPPEQLVQTVRSCLESAAPSVGS
jgi:CheY-like chemotaxis protein